MRRLENLYRADLPSRAIVVYMYLSDRAGVEDSCFPGVPRIPRDTGLSERTVQRDGVMVTGECERTRGIQAEGKSHRAVRDFLKDYRSRPFFFLL